MERKNYDELTFTDYFMFNKVMQDKNLCRKVLSQLLGEDVGPLYDVVNEKNIQTTAESKPIRLDIFTKDNTTCYDAEMQNKNNQSLDNLALPRRARFYQSMMDNDALEKNQNYRELMDSKIIFICTFDPFNLGFPIYTFSNRCSEDPSISLYDGCTKYFYNVTADTSKIPNDLKAFFRYTVSGEVADELTREIDDIVRIGRTNEAWRDEYMQINIFEQDAKEEGRAEGRAEGRETLLLAQINDGEISIESAAKRLKITPEEFIKKFDL